MDFKQKDFKQILHCEAKEVTVIVDEESPSKNVWIVKVVKLAKKVCTSVYTTFSSYLEYHIEVCEGHVLCLMVNKVLSTVLIRKF